MARVRVPVTKSFFKRAGWVLLTLLFVGTGLGIGLISFWQNTHQNNTPDTSQTNTCAFDTPPAETDALPDVYKPSGDITQLQVTDLQPGTGTAAEAGKCLTVKYFGTLASDGQVFDEDFDKPQGLKFSLGTGAVIPGWDQGLLGMKVGGVRRLVIPANLAYGNQANGSIPANANLVFVVKLLAVN